MDDRLYFGRPGALQVIPDTRAGREITRVRRRSRFDLGSGGVRTATIVGGKRTVSLNWQALDAATWAYLESFDQGHQGQGPFVYLDPSRRNMLTDNQSAATSVTNDASNFTVTGSGGTIASEATIVKRGPRSLRWNFATATPASAILSLSAPSLDFPGIPVAVRAHSFCVQAQAVVGPVTLQAQIQWLDKAGGALTTATGSAVAVAVGSWTPVKVVNALAPAGAAFALCSVVATPATIAAGESVILDELQLVEGADADATWSPGTGVLPVDVVSLSETPPFAYTQYREGPTLVLQEVGG